MALPCPVTCEVGVNPWLIASLWVGLALIATMFSIRLGISVALVEIAVGVLAGNFLHLTPNEWVSFLASFGSVLLTFLAGAEIDPDVLRANLKESLLIGFFSFLAPALGAFAAAHWIFHWNLQAAQIAGIALARRATLATRNVRHLADLMISIVDPWAAQNL